MTHTSYSSGVVTALPEPLLAAAAAVDALFEPTALRRLSGTLAPYLRYALTRALGPWRTCFELATCCTDQVLVAPIWVGMAEPRALPAARATTTVDRRAMTSWLTRRTGFVARGDGPGVKSREKTGCRDEQENRTTGSSGGFILCHRSEASSGHCRRSTSRKEALRRNFRSRQPNCWHQAPSPLGEVAAWCRDLECCLGGDKCTSSTWGFPVCALVGGILGA